jgi:hypothetical protein
MAKFHVRQGNKNDLPHMARMVLDAEFFLDPHAIMADVQIPVSKPNAAGPLRERRNP